MVGNYQGPGVGSHTRPIGSKDDKGVVLNFVTLDKVLASLTHRVRGASLSPKQSYE